MCLFQIYSSYSVVQSVFHAIFDLLAAIAACVFDGLDTVICIAQAFGLIVKLLC